MVTGKCAKGRIRDESIGVPCAAHSGASERRACRFALCFRMRQADVWEDVRRARGVLLVAFLAQVRADCLDPMDDFAFAEATAHAHLYGPAHALERRDMSRKAFDKWIAGGPDVIPHPWPGMCDPPPPGTVFVPEMYPRGASC